MFRQNQIIIDLDAIRHNYLLMKNQVPPEVRVMAVVKANAYGHGILELGGGTVSTWMHDRAVQSPRRGSAARQRPFRRIFWCWARDESSGGFGCGARMTQNVFETEMVAVLTRRCRMANPRW